MLAVAATGDGFVAVGSHGPLPAAWTTPKGLDLAPGRPAAPVRGDGGGPAARLAAAGETVVATGVARTAAGLVPYAARSADGGRTWTESPPARARRHRAGQRGGRGQRRVTVTGTFGTTAGDRDVVVWTSRDRTTWRESTHRSPPGCFRIRAITGLTVSGRTLTGVGFSATPAGEQPTIWQFPPHSG